MSSNDTKARVAPKDRIRLYLEAARAACTEQRDYYRNLANEVKTGDLNNPEAKIQLESVLEDHNRYQFGIDQIDILQRYLT